MERGAARLFPTPEYRSWLPGTYFFSAGLT